MFGLFKRKDPICGMKEEKGKGVEEDGKWFCNKKCADEYKEAIEKNKNEPRSCCS